MKETGEHDSFSVMDISFRSLNRLFLFIWQFVCLQKWRFLAIFTLSALWSLDQTIWPLIIGKIVDTLTLHDLDRLGAWPILKWQLIGGAVFWIILSCGYRWRDFLRAKAFPQLEANIRLAMFDHIQQHSPHYFNKHFSGSLANKITDMTTQTTLILLDALVFVPAIVTCLITMVLFYMIAPIYTLIIAFWLAIHFFLTLALALKCVRFSHVHGAARTMLSGKMIDSLTNNFTVNLFTAFNFERENITVAQEVEKNKNYQALHYMAVMLLLLSVVDLLGGFLINGFTFYSWMQSQVSTGTIIQVFSTTLNLMFMIWFSGVLIPQFFQSVGIINQAYTAMQDPQDISDIPNAVDLHVTKGEIKFQAVSFGYGESLFIENEQLHIGGGEKVGLVGYSGAGKSTFVKLILRFYPLEKGSIIIDDQDISEATLTSLRQQVSLIPQDPLLFHRTFEENIRYGRLDATSEQIVQAAKLAHCHEFIMKTPQGYASLVGERGTKISGGERQRIAIARAILANTPILILDEATSSLDSQTEGFIQESIEKLMENRTTIVVAHRLATLRKMDRIIVFHHGRIIEQGSHEELLKKNGHYARMWNMQADGFMPNKPG